MVWSCSTGDDMPTSHAGMNQEKTSVNQSWQQELLFAVSICALVITLYIRWFAVRDRYFIFLYFHYMGQGFETSPFGWVTVSRYWMTGLVASGAVMIPYLAANLVLGSVFKTYHAPTWWRIWLWCAIPLLVIVPGIVMTVNDPVLPLLNAAQITAALLAGLALAVFLGQYAAARPIGFILLLLDGLALAALLMALRAAEFYPRWLARGSTNMIHRFLAVLAFGAGLLIVMTALYHWWRKAHIPDAVSTIVASVNIHYLFLPIYHHLFWCKDYGSWTDPDYFTYIPDADNYFARTILIQCGVWIVVILVALGTTRLRLWLRQRTAAHRARTQE